MGRRLAKFLVISCVVLTAGFVTSQQKKEMSPEIIIAKKNWTGSAKGMEPDMFVELVRDLTDRDVNISAITGWWKFIRYRDSFCLIFSYLLLKNCLTTWQKLGLTMLYKLRSVLHKKSRTVLWLCTKSLMKISPRTLKHNNKKL